jgi:hypothetical protein
MTRARLPLALAASLALAAACARAGAVGPPDPREALAPPPPVPGLSEASETVYAAVFRAAAAGRAPDPYVREPDLLRPLEIGYRWEGEAGDALEALALSLGWKVRRPPGSGAAAVAAGPGTPSAARGRALDLLLAIDAALAPSGEAVRVDVFTRTFTIVRSVR